MGRRTSKPKEETTAEPSMESTVEPEVGTVAESPDPETSFASDPEATDRPTVEGDPSTELLADASIETPIAEPAMLETLAAASALPVEVEPVARAVDEATGPLREFFRCGGCGRPGPEAWTEEQALKSALDAGWFMSDHVPPVPYCCGKENLMELGIVSR
jgi:hypothetical protein